jgi:hypothetical protein
MADDMEETLVVTEESEREMALIMRASLIAMAESLLAMRAGVLAVIGALERRYKIAPNKKAKSKP